MVAAKVNPPGYPAQWEADILLSDGGVAQLRPIKPSDAQLLVEFYDRVSPESKYLRFFAPYPKLSERDVARFTQVDYVDRVALIITIGEAMIAVGRYDRIEGDHAEVAFLVEDAHQGRGIAQLLLEHLAEAARERGITRFVAEVLPQNRRMAQVFAAAGYRVSKGLEDGVLSVEFPILPTNTSVGVMERREHRAEATSVRRLLSPERVVVYGPGARVQGLVNAIVRGGFRGETFAVSTDQVEVAGVPVAESIAAIQGRIDLALANVSTPELGEVVIDVAHHGARGIVVLTGTEAGPDDSLTLVNLARAYGIRALGPDALGLINTETDVALNATPGPTPRPGGVGMFCQSAAIGVDMLNSAVRLGLGVSSFVSTGNYADVTGNDVIQFWEDDPATRVCLLSLDSIGNPRKFSRIARRLTRRKPTVVFAPGRASRGSHLGDRGGLGHAPEAAVDELFRQAGVLVVHRRGAMFDIAAIAARQPLPAGPRVCLVTNSATLAQQMRDTIRAEGLSAEPEPTVLPPDAGTTDFVQAIETAQAAEACDSVVCAAVRVFDPGTDSVRLALERLAATAAKPLVAVLLDFDETAPTASGPDELGGLPVFDAPTDAIQALAAVVGYACWRDQDPGAVVLLESDPAAAKRLVNRVLAAEPRGRELTDAEVRELLHAYGIDPVTKHRVRSLDEAIAIAERLGWNVVLKATADAVRGRPDLASVHRNLDGPEEIADAWRDLTALLGELGLEVDDELSVAVPVVQAMAARGVSIVVTSREDAAFGPIVSLGLDGIPSELLGDTVYRVPPLTTADAAAMIRELRAAPTLLGRHGSPGVDVSAVEDLLHRVAQLADDLPQLAALTLKPCLASPNGIAVLGASAFIAPTGDLRDPLARTL